MASYRELLSDRRYLFYFASQISGDSGYAVYAISVIWLALEISGSLFVAGLVLAVEFAIYSLSFAIGPFVDRVRNLRSVLLIGYPIQAALALTLAGLEYAHELTVPGLLVLVVAISFVWDFTWTATNAIPPKIVGPDALFRANGLTSAVSGGNQIAGYAAGAALILVVGPAGGAVLYGILNLVAAGFAVGVSAPQAARGASSFRTDFVDGWKHVLGGVQRPLLQLSSFSAAQAFFSSAPVLLIALAASTEFSHPAESYGILFTAFAIGGVVGGITLGQLNPRRHLGWIWIGASITGGGLIVLAVLAAPQLIESIGTWFLVGLIDVAFYQVLMVFFQATTPAPLLARTLTNTYVFRGSSRSAGALVVGALALTLSVPALGGVVGSVFIGVGLIGWVALPVVRRMRF
jgi:hypothetical protein